MKKLHFISENVAIEHLRQLGCTYVGEVIEVRNLWPAIKSKIVERLFLDKKIASYYQNHGGADGVEFNDYLSSVKDIKITNLSFAKLMSNEDNLVKYEFFVTGKYISHMKRVESSERHSINLLYVGRELCSALGLYDPFNFGGDDGISVTLHKNHSVSHSSIDSLITATDAIPFIIVLYKDKCFKRIAINDMVKYLGDLIEKNEINDEMFDLVKTAYPRLFLPKLTKVAVAEIFEHLTKLMTDIHQHAKKSGNPLLLLISEIHDSKDSFLLQAMILLIAHKIEICHLALETINLHHGKHGFDAPVESTHHLIKFAINHLGMNVIDLEAELNYKGIKSPYPYHELPDGVLSESFRETSWIYDMIKISASAVLIVGTDHMNNLLKSELNQHYNLLPINTTADWQYSLKKNTADKNFIPLDYSTWQHTHDQLLSLILENEQKL